MGTELRGGGRHKDGACAGVGRLDHPPDAGARAVPEAGAARRGDAAATAEHGAVRVLVAGGLVRLDQGQLFGYCHVVNCFLFLP